MNKSMHQTADSPAALTPVDREAIRADLKRLGDYVRAQLVEHDMTVSQAARVCHASRSTFARRLASGNMLVDWLFYLADEFGMRPSELVPPESAAA